MITGKAGPEGFAARLQFALKGESVNSFAKRSGVGESSIRQYLSGSMPGIDKAKKVADALDVSFEWLVNGEPESLAGKFLRQVDAAIGAPAKREDAIPNLLTHAGMGSGGIELVEVDENGHPLELYTDGGWSFPDGIASGFHSRKGIYSIEVEGDSMEPNYRGGSTVFVDTKNTRPTPPGVFIVDYGDGLLLKRVELIGGTDQIAIISDNKDLYRSYEFPRDEVTIWGRVIAKWEWVK